MLGTPEESGTRPCVVHLAQKEEHMMIVFYLSLIVSTGTYGFAMLYGIATWSTSV